MIPLLVLSQAATAAQVSRADPEGIVLDGLLEEPAWQIEAYSDFEQVEPRLGEQPTYVSNLSLLLGDNALYVGLVLRQPVQTLIAQELIQERSVEGDDHVAIYLDPTLSGDRGYVFLVNPNAVRNEGLIFNTDEIDLSWEGLWDAAVAIGDDHWSIEVRIPLRTLTVQSQLPAWGINVSRRIAHLNEVAAWSTRDRRVDVGTAREVSGFDNVQTSRGVDAVIGSSLTVRRDFLLDRTSSDFEPSLDVFYQLTGSLTAALTLNTDFSAAEVDQRELNITRFDLFFPERRDFFLQDSNLFEFADLEENGRPFFSRRLGLSEDGLPLDIRAGVKLTGTSGPFAIGALALTQDIEQGATDETIMVARLQAEASDYWSVGAIATSGNPQNGQSDLVIGADARYQRDDLLDDQELEAFFWFQEFRPAAGPSSPQAFGATVAWPNDRLDAVIGVRQFDAGFLPPVGFVNRDGIREYFAEATYRVRPETSRIRIADIGLEGLWIRADDGMLESRMIEATPFDLRNHAGDQFEVVLIDHFERLDEAFDPVDDFIIPEGSYSFLRRRIEFSSAEQRIWQIEAALEDGPFFNADLQTLEASIRWRPHRRFTARLDYERNDLTRGLERSILSLSRLSLGLAFNAKWSLTSLLQYDSESREAGINARLRWQPRSDREAFLIINHGGVRLSDDSFQSLESSIALKATFTVQF